MPTEEGMNWMVLSWLWGSLILLSLFVYEALTSFLFYEMDFFKDYYDDILTKLLDGREFCLRIWLPLF